MDPARPAPKASRPARVLVTGASGFVGRHVCRALGGAGFSVVAHWHRRRPPAGFETWHCDLAEPAARLSPPACDAIVHLAAWSGEGAQAAEHALAARNVAMARAVARIAAEAGAHLVHLSSAKVLGEWGEWTDDSPPAPQSAYARSKLAAEGEIRRSPALRFTILRPPPIYGPGVRGNFLRLLRLADTPWPLPLASCSAPRSVLSVANLADALLACLRSPASVGRTWLVADAQLSVAELLAAMRRHLGRSPRLWPLPLSWLRLAGRSSRRAGLVETCFRPFRLQDSGIRSALGWAPPRPCAEELALLCRWYRERGREPWR